jgi:hypothetical protein
MRAARYLNWRINRQVNLEDKALIERVQAGMRSSSYTVGPLSSEEVCLRSFARRMRARLGCDGGLEVVGEKRGAEGLLVAHALNVPVHGAVCLTAAER